MTLSLAGLGSQLHVIDAAYDSSNPEQQAIWDNNPGARMLPPWPEAPLGSVEAYTATVRRLIPSLNAIWGPVMELEVEHSTKLTPEGKVIDKMSDAESRLLRQTTKSHAQEFAAIKVPVLSVFCIHDGHDFLSQEYMTAEQQAEVLAYFDMTRTPFTRRWIEQFRRLVPHARTLVIENGHHYCFLKQEEVVFQEMKEFLLEA